MTKILLAVFGRHLSGHFLGGDAPAQRERRASVATAAANAQFQHGLDMMAAAAAPPPMQTIVVAPTY
jgi:hypothetical protein